MAPALSLPVPQGSHRCRPLDLPPEIRNKIYHIHLGELWEPHLELHNLWYFTDGLEIPSLLQTCRQLREEAGRVYLATAQLHVDIELKNCDPSLLMLWVNFVRSIFAGESHAAVHARTIIDFRTTGVVSWDNLKKWCKLVWEGHLWVAPTDGCSLSGPRNEAMRLTHRLAVQHRNKPWKDCEEVLDVLYDSISEQYMYQDHQEMVFQKSA